MANVAIEERGYFDERDHLRGIIDYLLAKGWRPREYNEEISAYDIYQYGIRKITFFNEFAVRFQIPLYELIFSPKFAKALWGEDHICTSCERIYQGGEIYCRSDLCGAENRQTEVWFYHIQQMVVTDQPVKYIMEHLPDDYRL